MKSVLTISPSEEITSLIHSALPSDYHREGAVRLKDGLKLHRKRHFDLILSDLNLLRDGFPASDYAAGIKPFQEVYPLVKFVVLSSKERIREAVKTIKTATNADFGGMSERGEFRKDLFYRLNVFTIEIPPLRERLDDIPLPC